MLRRVAVASMIMLAGIASVAQAQVKLEIKHREGTKAKVQSLSKTHQILSLNGMDIETSSEESATVRSSVGTRRADGTLPIELKIESLRAQINLPGNMVISFDSANPPEKKDESPLGFLIDLFKVLAGSSYTMILDKQDKIVAVEGTQQVLDKAGALNPMALELLKNRMDVEHIKRTYEVEAGVFPSILVRPGETWEKEEANEIGGGQTLTFKKRYEYQGTVEKDGAKLDKIGVKALSVAYSMDPNTTSPAKVEKSDLKIDSSDSTILFDRTKGHIVERTGKTKITGDMTLSINGTEIPSKLDLTLESSLKVQD
jgi:uncharacterized protein DUF6263